MAKTTEQSENFKASEEKAFQLLTIARFILANTPMILGYAVHNAMISELNMMTLQIHTSYMDTNKVLESKEWSEIKKLLNNRIIG